MRNLLTILLTIIALCVAVLTSQAALVPVLPNSFTTNSDANANILNPSVAYVSAAGSDTKGIVGNRLHPFATINTYDTATFHYSGALMALWSNGVQNGTIFMLAGTTNYNTALAIPTNYAIIGESQDTCWIIQTNNGVSTALVGALIHPRDNSRLENVTCWTTNVLSTGTSALGHGDSVPSASRRTNFGVAEFTVQMGWTNFSARNCRFIGDADSIDIRSTNRITYRTYDCIIDHGWDGVWFNVSNGVSAHFNPTVRARYVSNTGRYYSRDMIFGSGSSNYISGGRFVFEPVAQDPGVLTNKIGVYINDTATSVQVSGLNIGPPNTNAIFFFPAANGGGSGQFPLANGYTGIFGDITVNTGHLIYGSASINFQFGSYTVPLIQSGTTNVALVAAGITIPFSNPFPNTNYTGVAVPVGGASVLEIASKTTTNMTTTAVTFTGNLDWTATKHTQ